MGKSLTLAVIGGDERQVFLASLALADGHAVRTFALDRANIEGAAVCSDAASCTEGADAVLLPVPVMQGDGLLRAPLARTETDVTQVLDAIPAGVRRCGPLSAACPGGAVRCTADRLSLARGACDTQRRANL